MTQNIGHKVVNLNPRFPVCGPLDPMGAPYLIKEHKLIKEHDTKT
jgi:hypothetical protein